MRLMIVTFHLCILNAICITMSIAQTDAQSNDTITEKLLTNDETKALLDELIHEKMDNRVRPNVDGGPTAVQVGIYVISFGSISDLNMDYNMEIYLRQSWQDDRLKFTASNKPLSITSFLVKNMWTPDLFFPTEKNAAFHVVTVPNMLMRIYPDGRVIYSMRLTLTLSCPMDLTNFPMDHQNCGFTIESYSYTDTELSLQWFDDYSVEFEENIELPQFNLAHVETAKCDSKEYKTGAYPCLKARFGLTRQFGYFMLQTYIPSILIVIISWVSFWISQEAVPARVALGVTTVLTMAAQLSGSKGSIPKISYPKAIDVWMATCMLMVFGALIEYAIVNARLRQDKRKSELNSETNTDFGKPVFDLFSIRKSMREKRSAKLVDKISRILFPGIFLIFNLFYWPFFTYHRYHTDY